MADDDVNNWMVVMECKYNKLNEIDRKRQMQVGWVKIGHFWRKTCYNMKTVQDRCIVSVNVE